MLIHYVHELWNFQLFEHDFMVHMTAYFRDFDKCIIFQYFCAYMAYFNDFYGFHFFIWIILAVTLRVMMQLVMWRGVMLM